ncbi:spondin domain-containing protein [Paremcibacter congregatus]|uniref:Spondin domain-containing protein n=1 Tax=Paremcibacter congregatus TaxID=2043170 RepID=A0A2G4YV91_9PROT|nr:spondin domain-containing protein [Paremcibacter congregatus]PHZ86248.1 hypothetical protein CRD36_06170 [Paremcibacter congregatus]QDE27214.1 hypothetical protein FIV45_07935 [Paremcibacter congregatus]
MIFSIRNMMLAVTAGILNLSTAAQATTVEVEVTNLFAPGGLAMTPVWVGFHGGSFDSFDSGTAASASVQALAERGDASGVSADFNSISGGVQGVVAAPSGFPGAPVFEPGEVASALFNITAATNGYLSFLSMLIPTNDAFIGNDDAMAYSLFDSQGNFQALDILVIGGNVWDAGTEANIGYDSPFLIGAGGMPRQDEGSVIGVHGGLATLPGGFPIFGGDTPAGYSIAQAAADFTAQGFEVARIRVSQVSSPAAFGLMGLGLFGVMALSRRKRLLA